MSNPWEEELWIPHTLSKIFEKMPYGVQYDYRGHQRYHGIWSDGSEILCPTEHQADVIADFIDAMIGYPISHTGYYDPKEDERSGEVDDHTGYWYVDWD